MSLINDFTLRGFKDLLRAFDGLGYVPRSFHDVEATQSHLVLRHDIDYCLDYALPIAEVEAQEGVRASYYILMHSEFYNPLTSSALQSLRQLIEQGHEIGLHFDASQYDQDFTVLDKACERECVQLEEVIGQAVRSVSFHRPAKTLMGLDEPLGGRVHAYQPKYFSDMGYCADSQGRFRYGHPLEHACISQKTAMQLVIHPVWWWHEESEAPVDRLNRFLTNKACIMSEQMAENSIPFKDYIQAQKT